MDYIVAVLFILKLVLCSAPVSPPVSISSSPGGTVVEQSEPV